jgi:adenosylcobyric acid synthase
MINAEPSHPLAPVLMIVGTCSSAGKSTVVAALCRIFRQEGWNVAPFKAQNMSNNAGVTDDGGEIGRAQMLQARSAGVRPTVQMNPILLKPVTDVGSQVVVLGQAVATEDARAYYRRTDALWPVVTGALDALRREYDLVIAEGAGSPAEINLRDRDLVNMRVAQHAGAITLLVGDIERGGVFAALYGTHALLLPEHRPLLRGFIINRFRGDVSLVEPGPAMLEAMTGVPTLGVVPWLQDLQLPEEDALGIAPDAPWHPDALKVAVICLPHLANFDDIDPLRHVPGVHAQFVTTVARAEAADLVIIPGTKATIPDLEWMREHGFVEWIAARAGDGVPIVGLCGGLQMLGERVDDPSALESPQRSAVGIGLLPITTVLAPRKTVRLRDLHVQADHGLLAGMMGLTLSGYEIHAGITTAAVVAEVTTDAAGAGALREALVAAEHDPADGLLGIISPSGTVFGTYLHGLFENPGFVTRLLANAALLRNRPTMPGTRLARNIDHELDRLAAHFRQHVDIPRVIRWVQDQRHAPSTT